MSASRRIHTLVFQLQGLAGEDAADEILDDIEEFADGMAWPLGQPDAYKFHGEEPAAELGCAVELPVRAKVSAGTIEAEKHDFEAAMALVEHLRRVSLAHGLDIEVDFDDETIGSIDKGVFSPSLQRGLIEPWSERVGSGPAS